MRLHSSEVQYTESTRFTMLKHKLNEIIVFIKRIRWADLKSTRFLLSTVTILFTITGLVLLTEGVSLLGELNKYDLFVAHAAFDVLPKFMIATAVFIFVIAILGFYGVISGKYKFVIAYAVLLVSILVFEIAITVLAFDLQDNAHYYILRQMETFDNYYTSRWYGFGSAWDLIQRELRCCSFSSNENWDLDRLPISCCYIPEGAISPFTCTKPGNAYYYKCDYALASVMMTRAYDIGVIGAVFSCLQGIIIGVAAWMAYRLKHKQEIPFSEYVNKNSQSQKVPPNPLVIDY